MPDTSKLGKLNRELEKSEKKLRKAINDEKALQHQLKPVSYTHLAALFNSVSTIDNHYAMLVNHDFHGGP